MTYKHTKKHIDMRRERGLCLWAGCKNDPAYGHRYCKEHAQRLNAYNRARYAMMGEGWKWYKQLKLNYKDKEDV